MMSTNATLPQHGDTEDKCLPSYLKSFPLGSCCH